MSQKLLVALNARWRGTGHPYAVGEGAQWSLRCPICRGLEGERESLVAALGSALRHNQVHRPSTPPNGQVPHPGRPS